MAPIGGDQLHAPNESQMSVLNSVVRMASICLFAGPRAYRVDSAWENFEVRAKQLMVLKAGALCPAFLGFRSVLRYESGIGLRGEGRIFRYPCTFIIIVASQRP